LFRKQENVTLTAMLNIHISRLMKNFAKWKDAMHKMVAVMVLKIRINYFFYI
jgi:hypothetical protein